METMVVKPIFTFIVSILLVSNLLSQNGTFVFVSETGNPFILKVNDSLITSKPQSNVKVKHLDTGKQLISIKETIDNKEYQLLDSIFITDKVQFQKKEFTFGVVLEKKKLRLKFRGVSDYSGESKLVIPEPPKETAPLVDNSLYGNLYQAKNNKPVFFKNYNTDSAVCKQPLNDKEISYAKSLLIKCNDEETKLKYLKEIIQNNCFSISQFKIMVELIPIDMDRLNLSKSAYSHFTDKQNISSLTAVFKYQSMKESFLGFIKEEENIVKQKAQNCSTPINSMQFDELFLKIKNGGYENEKVALAKKLLVNVCLNTQQTKSLVQLFTHDRETLDFMKSAYHVLTDKQNAKDLLNEFQFTETKEEFLKYISK